MADNPFDQTNYGLRERPVSADWNQLSSQLYQTIREVHRFTHDARVSAGSSAAQSISGFHGAGLRVVPSSPIGMSVAVSAGLGFMHAPTDVPVDLGATDLESVDDRSPYKPLIVQTPQTFNVPVAPSSPNSRIDIIEVRNPRRLENAIPRRQLDPNTLSYDDHVFFKTLAFQIDNLQCGTVNDPSPSTAPLSYKAGTAGNPGLVPPTTPGYIKIAEVLVGNTTTTITGLQIVDRRTLLSNAGGVRGYVRWRQQFNAGAPIVTILSMIAPPGIDVAIVGDILGRNAGTFTVLGGEITQAFLMVQPTTNNGSGSITGTIDGDNFNPVNMVQTLTGTTQANILGISAGAGQKMLASGYVAFFQDARGPGGTQLDDVVWDATFALGYI